MSSLILDDPPERPHSPQLTPRVDAAGEMLAHETGRALDMFQLFHHVAPNKIHLGNSIIKRANGSLHNLLICVIALEQRSGRELRLPPHLVTATITSAVNCCFNRSINDTQFHVKFSKLPRLLINDLTPRSISIPPQRFSQEHGAITKKNGARKNN